LPQDSPEALAAVHGGRWGALAAVAFGAVTPVVAGHEGSAAHHPHVTARKAVHRTEWLTSIQWHM